MKKIVVFVVFALASCTVDRELEPSFKNDIEQFSFIKMKILGEEVNKNLSLYGNGLTHGGRELSNSWKERSYEYVGFSQRESPYQNYFADLAGFYCTFSSRVQSGTLADRIGKTYAIDERTNRDNNIYLEMNCFGLPLSMKYTGLDSVTYLNIKDTLIASRNYELTHLLFHEVVFELDTGDEIIVNDLELRQVLYINEW